MRLTLAATLSVFTFMTSCQTPTLKPAHDRKTASESEAGVNENYDLSNDIFIRKLLEKQKSLYYFSQQKLFDFDSELDKLYQKKQTHSGELTDLDFEKMAELRSENYAAWAFSEENLHELSHIYTLTVKAANNPKSPYYKPARTALNYLRTWFDNKWTANEKALVIYLAQNFDSVNTVIKQEFEKQPFKKYDLNIVQNINTVNLAKFVNTSVQTKSFAYKQSFKYLQNRVKTHMDYSIERDVQQYKYDKREFLDQIRTPQALDVLEPDASAKGHVSGNRFPVGKWALTYDDGPHPTHTAGMMTGLKNQNVHGTFFWQTQNLIKYPKYSQIAKDNNFARALHSYTHANLPKLSSSGLNKEITLASQDFAKVVGERPTLFRCPYGACGPMGSSIRQLIAQNKMLHIAWNVDTLDWQDKNPDSIYERTRKQIEIQGRGIVLFHDIHPQSVIASERVIKFLKSKYTVEPLHKLIEESRGKPYYTP